MNKIKIFIFIITILFGCSKTLSQPQDNPPQINSFAVSRSIGPIPLNVTFSWSVYDTDKDSISCYLDVDSDGVAEAVIKDCSTNNTFSWTYNISRIYNVTLTAFDKYGQSSSKTLTIRACRVLSDNNHNVPSNNFITLPPFNTNAGDSLYIKAYVVSGNQIDYIKLTNLVDTLFSYSNFQANTFAIYIPQYRQYQLILGNTTSTNKTYHLTVILNAPDCQ